MDKIWKPKVHFLAVRMSAFVVTATVEMNLDIQCFEKYIYIHINIGLDFQKI